MIKLIKGYLLAKKISSTFGDFAHYEVVNSFDEEKYPIGAKVLAKQIISETSGISLINEDDIYGFIAEE